MCVTFSWDLQKAQLVVGCVPLAADDETVAPGGDVGGTPAINKHAVQLVPVGGQQSSPMCIVLQYRDIAQQDRNKVVTKFGGVERFAMLTNIGQVLKLTIKFSSKLSP